MCLAPQLVSSLHHLTPSTSLAALKKKLHFFSGTALLHPQGKDTHQLSKAMSSLPILASSQDTLPPLIQSQHGKPTLLPKFIQRQQKVMLHHLKGSTKNLDGIHQHFTIQGWKKSSQEQKDGMENLLQNSNKESISKQRSVLGLLHSYDPVNLHGTHGIKKHPQNSFYHESQLSSSKMVMPYYISHHQKQTNLAKEPEFFLPDPTLLYVQSQHCPTSFNNTPAHQTPHYLPAQQGHSINLTSSNQFNPCVSRQDGNQKVSLVTHSRKEQQSRRLLRESRGKKSKFLENGKAMQWTVTSYTQQKKFFSLQQKLLKVPPVPASSLPGTLSLISF